MAQKYGEPVARSNPTTREYLYRWTLSNGAWVKVPYQYRDVVTLEYRQPCDRDYAKEAIGSPGAGYEIVMFDKLVPVQGFAELVTVYRSLITLTWTDI